MFTNTIAVIAKIIEDLQKIAFVCFLIVQLFYIAFLSTSLFLGSGILIINIILLIVSIAYFVLRIVSYKIDFKNKKAIMKLGNTAYRRIKIGTQIFTVFSMLYGFFIASEQQSSWALVVMFATAILCVVQILIECAIQFIENRWELLVDAFKHDFSLIYKVADFWQKRNGDETTAWGNADKNAEKIKSITKEFKEEEKTKKKVKAAVRKQNRKERRADAKTKFLAKFKREPSV